MKYLLDSNIIIDYARGYSATLSYLHELIKDEDDIYISVVTEAELFAGRSFGKLDKFLSDELPAIVIPIDSRNARLAGTLKRQCATSLVDALIAATAMNQDLTLVTKNLKHFQSIPDLKIVSP